MLDAPDPLDLPILDELGAELSRAFRASETAARPTATNAAATPPSTGPAAARDAQPLARSARPAASRARRRLRRALRRTVGGAVAAAAVVGAVALASGVGDGGVGPTRVDAATVLRQAASAAEQGPGGLPSRADQYAYVDELDLDLVVGTRTGDGDDPRTVTSFALSRRRTWSSFDRGTQATVRRIRQTKPGDPPPTLEPDADARTGGDPAVSLPLPSTSRDADGTEHLPHTSTRYFIGTERMTPRSLLAYPTDPAAIYRRLRASTAGQGPSPNGEVWVAINDALRSVPLPAALAAGLYRTLATMPGVRLDGETRDRLGRRVLRVSYQEPGSWDRDVLLLDPQRHTRLGEQTVVAGTIGKPATGVPPTTADDDGASAPVADAPRPELAPGTVTRERLVLASGVTDRIGGPLVAR